MSLGKWFCISGSWISHLFIRETWTRGIKPKLSSTYSPRCFSITRGGRREGLQIVSQFLQPWPYFNYSLPFVLPLVVLLKILTGKDFVWEKCSLLIKFENCCTICFPIFLLVIKFRYSSCQVSVENMSSKYLLTLFNYIILNLFCKKLPRTREKDG